MNPNRFVPVFVSLVLLSACGDDDPTIVFVDAGDGAVDGSIVDASDAGVDSAIAPTPACGDGTVDADLGETCDDHNAVTETCVYGEASCTVCDASCHSVSGATSICGDDIVDHANGEECDGIEICDASCKIACAQADATDALFASTGCYLFYDATPLAFDDAETACITHGGHLISLATLGQWFALGDWLYAREQSTFAGIRVDDMGAFASQWTSGEPFTGIGPYGESVAEVSEAACVTFDGIDWSTDDCASTYAYVCEFATCGDGFVSSNETCDDGNAIDGDGCDTNCEPTACGNQIADPAEGCDDGNLVDGDACPSTCSWPCGDVLHPETVLETSMGCYASVDKDVTYDEAVARCTGAGGSLLHVAAARENTDIRALSFGSSWLAISDTMSDGAFGWDDGIDTSYRSWGNSQPNNSVDARDCGLAYSWNGTWATVRCSNHASFVCEFPTCGNGTIDGLETCDDGNFVDGDGCDSNCVATGCGNGNLNAGEDCDDGNLVDFDGCPSTCTFPCGDGSGASGFAQNSLGCYLRFSDSRSWSDAVATCQTKGGTLLHPTSDYESALMRRFIGTAPVWLGLNDIDVEGTYVWADGIASSYLAWSPSEPNNSGGDEDCGEFMTNGQFNDLTCSQSRRYVCEIATCGNGSVDGVEQCDAADGTDGDGCDTNCMFTACGNGIITAGESCDDGNLVDGDGCESDCALACGEGSDALAARIDGGACYLAFASAPDWATGESACVDLGGHLVAIGSQHENDLVAGFGLGGPFLGFTDAAVEDSFVWSSSAPVTYLHWAAGEPNDNGPEDCATMRSDMLWNDVGCANPAPYVCEIPVP